MIKRERRSLFIDINLFTKNTPKQTHIGTGSERASERARARQSGLRHITNQLRNNGNNNNVWNKLVYMNKLKTTGKKCHTQDTEPEKNENEKRDEKELREKNSAEITILDSVSYLQNIFLLLSTSN